MNISSAPPMQPQTLPPYAAENSLEYCANDIAAEAVATEQADPLGQGLFAVTRSACFSGVAASLRKAMDGFSHPEGKVTCLLSDNISRLQDQFIETLYTRFTEAGIGLENKMTLRLGQNATLCLAGDHPEKQAVATLLERMPDLSRAFNEIAAQSAALRNIQNLQSLLAVAESDEDNVHPLYATYQISLKGDMSHFYFAAL